MATKNNTLGFKEILIHKSNVQFTPINADVPMKTVYQRILDHFGKDMQVDKIQEECMELALALHQLKCPTKNRVQMIENIYKELADVKIMMVQAELIFDPDRINKYVDEKLKRCQDKYLKDK